MSDSQRRYLFQILAEHGTEGDAAHQRLKELFGVDSLAAVDKQTARAMIQRLLQEESRCTDRR